MMGNRGHAGIGLWGNIAVSPIAARGRIGLLFTLNLHAALTGDNGRNAHGANTSTWLGICAKNARIC